jgi:hypothetical protein
MRMRSLRREKTVITCHYMHVMACNNMSDLVITCMRVFLHGHYMHVLACNDHVIACSMHACNGHIMHAMPCNNILGVSLMYSEEVL